MLTPFNSCYKMLVITVITLTCVDSFMIQDTMRPTINSRFGITSKTQFQQHNLIKCKEFVFDIRRLDSVLQLKADSAVDEQVRAMELTPEEDATLIEKIMAEVKAETGVELDQLINPSKVVNLRRDLAYLNRCLDIETDPAEIRVIEGKIAKKTATLNVEKRAVMQGWLKNLFVAQSVLVVVLSYAVVEQWIPAPLSVQALGFWMWWLFIIPSLRYINYSLMMVS